MERGLIDITVPADFDDFKNDSISDENEMGVSFKAWLLKDPKQPVEGQQFPNIWWERKFYPTLDSILNDLHDKGLIAAGEYSINIDW